MLLNKLLNALRTGSNNNPTNSGNAEEKKFTNDKITNSEGIQQTIYFKNGEMYKVAPTNKESWYNARFLVSDGIKYDLENISDIKRIVVPSFPHHPSQNNNYGVTGSLDYVLRMKAGNFYDRNEKEMCSACLWKSTELMFANPSIGWRKQDYIRLIKWHSKLGMRDEAEKATVYLTEKGFIFTDVELNKMKGLSVKKEPLKAPQLNAARANKTKPDAKEKVSYIDKELAIVKSITTEDMRSLKNMPFVCNTEVKKFIQQGSHPFAYMDIVGENITIVKQEIDKINQIIKLDLKNYPQLPKILKIDTNKLVFASKYYGYTRIICTPKTYTGRASKYPYKLFFATDLSKSNNTCGELLYGKDGKVEKASINIWKDDNPVLLAYETINGHLTLSSIE